MNVELLDKLIAWLESKPADGTYSTISGRNCLFREFWDAAGLVIRPYQNSGEDYLTVEQIDNDFGVRVWDKVTGYDERPVYGDALERARRLRAEV